MHEYRLRADGTIRFVNTRCHSFPNPALFQLVLAASTTSETCICASTFFKEEPQTVEFLLKYGYATAFCEKCSGNYG